LVSIILDEYLVMSYELCPPEADPPMAEIMNNKIKVAPSILSADFGRLETELKKCAGAGADLIHLDIMDGHFVPNITFGPVVVEAIRRYTKLPLEAHLMIDQPEKYLASFIRAGADIITVHAECYPYPPIKSGQPDDDTGLAGPELPRHPPDCPDARLNPARQYRSGGDSFGQVTAGRAGITQLDLPKLQRDLRIIKSSDARTGLAINPGTPLCIEKILSEVDMVLIMSVNPGFAGQKFMESVIPKIKQLRAIYKGDIAVDGGITDKTAPSVVAAGANILVTASYFFSAPDPVRAIASLRS